MTRRAPFRESESNNAHGRAAQLVYPFTAIVGQEEMKLGLLLNVIDPLIGGVLIMGHRGTGKSTAVRALADLLPPLWKVRGCPYACDPAERENLCADCFEQLKLKGKLARERARVPVVDLPLGATEDRVCGTINIERALTTGIKAFDPGLLARANRGFLYVDEVNLLEDHLVDLLLDVAVTGRNTVERESLSLEHPARFVLVGSGNPEEGELRPQLLDRFGLHAEVKTMADLEQRVEIVLMREAFERDQLQFRAEFEAEQESLRRKLARARKLAGQVKLSRELLRGIAGLCLSLRIDGHRGELTLARAARALAAFEGRRQANEDDVRRVAALSLRHRLRRDPLEPTDGGARVEQALEKTFPQSASTGAQEQRVEKSNAGQGNGQNNDGNGQQDNHRERPAPAPLDARLPADALSHDSHQAQHKQSQPARQQRGAKRAAYNARHGRSARAVTHKAPGSKIALDATLRAAAINTTRFTHQQSIAATNTTATPYALHPAHFSLADLRYKRFKRKQGTLFILAIDTSGSMALNRIERAQGALVWLLNKSYIRRDRVAIVSFRGQSAEEILPPSQSMSRARRVLDGMLMGGPTPLSSALARSLKIARRAARQGTEQIVLLLFTDGRPNVPLREQASSSSMARQKAIMNELDCLGSALHEAQVTTVLVDTQKRFTSNGEGRALASRLGARYIYLSSRNEMNEQLAEH